ncbi:YIP1 family protein [bacterium]|nr:MAG: YIP1 family protein [bacterium]
MAEAELDTLNNNEHPRRLRFDWLLPLFFRPRRTLGQVSEQNHGVWLAPLLVLSVLVVIAVLAASPIRQQAAQMGGEIPPDFQYWSAEQQQQYMEAQANSAGPIFTLIFPALSALAGLWVSWFLLGSILHLALTLTGSRSSNTAALNLAAWASLPLGLRSIVQTIAMLANKQLIAGQGLSGFIASDATGLGLYLRSMLGFIDIYFVWMVVLLLIGAAIISGMRRGKAWVTTLVAVLILLALQALPGFIGGQLGGLSSGGSGFFFF